MRPILYALIVSVFLSGCFFTQPSSGELGNVELTYDEGILGCLFGCDASEPMAADSNTFLLVSNDSDVEAEFGPYVVSSSNTTVLETIQSSPGDAAIRLVSHEQGNARVVFEGDTSGDLIDRFQINVHEIDHIEVNTPEFHDAVLVFDGGTLSVYLNLFDAQNNHLKGFGGVDYALMGGLTESEVTITSALAAAIVGLFAGSTTESVLIEANGLGAGGISVTAMRGDASLQIPVEVVDASRVAMVMVSDSTVEPGDTTSVSATAFDANGDEIHDPVCVWEVAGTGVTTQFESRNSISVSATAETSAQITCTIGSATGSGTATFEPYMP